MFNKELKSNILIVPNIITDEGIDFILKYVDTQTKKDLAVFDTELTDKNKRKESSVIKEIRDTQYVDINPILEDLFLLYKNVIENVINPFYNIKIHDSEIPQLLCYNVGGHYNSHIDSEALWKTPTGELIWRKVFDRDLSTIIFLNDNFEGGELVFPELDITIKPKKGTLICFPSGRNYLHQVKPVTSGERYSLVNWLTVKGFESLKDEEDRLTRIYGVC